jgi:hypothetical protein
MLIKIVIVMCHSSIEEPEKIEDKKWSGSELKLPSIIAIGWCVCVLN